MSCASRSSGRYKLVRLRRRREWGNVLVADDRLRIEPAAAGGGEELVLGFVF